MDSKVVYSLYDDGFDTPFNKDFNKKLLLDGISDDDVSELKNPDFINLSKMAISHADAVIIGSNKVDKSITKYINSIKKPVLEYTAPEEYINAYSDFYDQVLTEGIDEE